MTTLDDVPVTDPLEARQPANEGAERSVVGAAMDSPAAFAEAAAVGLRAGDFYSVRYRAAWEAIASREEQGKQFDPLSVWEELGTQGTRRNFQGPADLSQMCGEARLSLAGTHAEIVMEKAAKRRGLMASAKIASLALRDSVTAAELQDAAEAAVQEIAAPVDETTWSTLDEVLDMVYAAAEHASLHGRAGGISWGLLDVDAKMSPLVPGELAIVAAFSGGGKSVVACGLALHAAVELGVPALVHAMEMTRLEVGQRWCASQAGVELERVISGQLTGSDQEKLDRANARMLGSPLVIDEVETVTLAGLSASIRKHKPGLVIVDQIPTMTPSDAKKTREQQVSDLAYGLKRLAKHHSVPIVACHQLNDESTRRADRLPGIHDLRESRAVAHAANTVVILSDPVSSGRESSRMGEMDWIVPKQRQGPNDLIIPMIKQFHYSRLADMARHS